MPRAYIALGANLGDPAAQIERALVQLSQLPQTSLLSRSRLYRSAPLGPTGQPDYCNAVASLDTGLAPVALLDGLQAIEQAAGRERGERWSARRLDLDLLIYDDLVWATPRLILPHPELANRRFVLQPLADIAPDLELPGQGPVTERLAALPHWELRPWS